MLAETVDGLACKTLTDEPLVTLLPRDHRLAHRRRLRVDEVLGEPVIVMSRRTEPSLYELYLQMCATAGVAPNVVLETDQLEAMLAFVASGIGISHAPTSVSQLRHRGVVALPMTPRIPSGISAIWNQASLSPVAERFLAVLWEEQARARRGSSSQ